MSAQHEPPDPALCRACGMHWTDCTDRIRTQGRACCPDCPGGDGTDAAPPQFAAGGIVSDSSAVVIGPDDFPLIRVTP